MFDVVFFYKDNTGMRGGSIWWSLSSTSSKDSNAEFELSQLLAKSI
jgi:hypothetical protein